MGINFKLTSAEEQAQEFTKDNTKPGDLFWDETCECVWLRADQWAESVRDVFVALDDGYVTDTLPEGDCRRVTLKDLSLVGASE